MKLNEELKVIMFCIIELMFNLCPPRPLKVKYQTIALGYNSLILSIASPAFLNNSLLPVRLRAHT